MRKKLFEKRRFISSVAVLLTFTMLISGCGKDDSYAVDDYYVGNDVTEASGNGVSEETEEASNSENSESKESGNLADRLGGKSVKYNGSMTVNGQAINFKLYYNVDSSIEKLPTYKAAPITENDVMEAEIVNNIFGDTATPLTGSDERSFDVNDGDSEYVIGCMETLAAHNAVDTKASGKPGIPTWIDNNDFYAHTYEGQYRNIDYQLIIAYSRKYGEKSIVLYPKNVGDVVGDSSLNQIAMIGSDGLLTVYENGKPKFIDVHDSMKDSPNKSKKSDEELHAMIMDSLKNQMYISLPEDGIALSMSGYGYYYATGSLPSGDSDEASSEKLELLYFNEGNIESEDMTGAVRDGYISISMDSISGIPMMIGVNSLNSLEALEREDISGGMIAVNDNGIVGINITACYNIHDMVTEDSKILSFDSAMDALRKGLEKDVPGITKCNFNDIGLYYYPVKSPDNPEEYTYIPAWVLAGTYGGSLKGVVILNAIDGSIVQSVFK
ncbi:MAG: hypothetical protein J6O17_07035 [Eubacterium sp.]|nr:hypothetical protein [Eubacterium sp.]